MTAAPNTFNAINGTGAVHPAHLDGTFAVKVSFGGEGGGPRARAREWS